MTINEYINKNINHLNLNVLAQLFKNEGIELTKEVKDYIRQTPKNTNLNVLRRFLGNSGGGTDNSAVVGTAIVGQAKVSSEGEG